LKSKRTPYRFLFAAGGTGGHLFPALAVAESIRELKPESEILFVGTSRKLEADVVPKYGFDFKTIWISGLERKFSWGNLLFPLKLFVAALQSFGIAFKFLPAVAIGAGAYVAGPVLWASDIMGAKILLLEQNSYPGITNRLLEKKASEVYLNFEESKKYFRFKEKLFVVGNPVRPSVKLSDKKDARKHFGLDAEKKTLFILGGSLGAGGINKAVERNLDKLTSKNLQIIWQVGKRYYQEYKKYNRPEVKVFDFIEEIGTAYSAADLVIARAGATTIAELAFLGLPAVFIPSPNVAANHQYKNAEVLARAEACAVLNEKEANEKLEKVILEIVFDENKLQRFSENISKYSNPDAAKKIAERAIALVRSN